VEPVLVFTAMGYVSAGPLLLAMLAIALISLRKEAFTDEPIRGLFPLALIILSLCAGRSCCSAAWFRVRSCGRRSPNPKKMKSAG